MSRWFSVSGSTLWNSLPDSVEAKINMLSKISIGRYNRNVENFDKSIQYVQKLSQYNAILTFAEWVESVLLKQIESVVL